MSSPDPNRSTDAPTREPDQAPGQETTDRSRKDTAADPNATEDHVPRTASARADGARSDSVFPAIPGFHVEGELGRGGMGVVYRARQTDLNRPVAIKMILGGKYTDPVAQARFLIEAEVIAAIQHPHIVQVFEFGRHDEQPFFVLEFVGGGSLAKKLKSAGRSTPRESAMMVAKLADAMAAAHQKGVIHRDLKPANVLLTESGEPKVTDFGLAKTGQSDMTASGAIMGTPSYMSPEQAAGKTREVGTPTDVYALGAILYELTTGRPPFKGDVMIATIQQVLTQEPQRPRAIDPKIPLDLETICLKCLGKDAKKRYATAVELAAELRAFLDGKPITARPVGLMERTWKWAKRNPAWASGIAAGVMLLIVATIAGLAIRAQVIAQQNATYAAGLVQAILNAETAQTPAIISAMAEYRKWTDPLLREEHKKAAANSRQQLHTSLALLPVDPGQVDYLFGRLLDATPHEFPVIRDALAPHKDALKEKLWAVALTPVRGKEEQRLRAAAALAKYDPASDHWAKVQVAVADDLVRVPAVYLAHWLPALRPVADSLHAPLAAIFRNSSRPATERALATDLVLDYYADQPARLAALVLDAEPKQFGLLYPVLAKHDDRAVAPLRAELKASGDQGRAREELVSRQANAAVAMLRMNQGAEVWPLLKHSHDPSLRSWLIHRFGPQGVDAAVLVKRLGEEPDITIRRALILSLGEYGEEQLSSDQRAALTKKLQGMYRSDADPGLHGAAEWLLRTWKEEAWLKEVNEEWAKDGEGRNKKITGIKELVNKDKEKASPQWYVNGQGQTMVVIPGPLEFLMGSPPTEADRLADEKQHQKRINRTFAIAAKSVTMEEYRKFEKNYKVGDAKYHRLPDLPAVGISWYMAAKYCNWLSKEEGILEEEWCYEIKGNEVKLRPKYLSLSGYRLPTEAEMEYATRAGALTARYFGETEELLPKYAWYSKNSQDKPWPVGSLKPNDLGLFDAQGNVFTWCQENYRASTGNEDTEDSLSIIATKNRVLRGGSSDFHASIVRSANRYNFVPTLRNLTIGFRPSRTLPLGAPTTLPLTPEGGRPPP